MLLVAIVYHSTFVRYSGFDTFSCIFIACYLHAGCLSPSINYEMPTKFEEHERGARVSRGVAEGDSSFLSALQTSQVLPISMNAQLTHESIVL